MPDDDTALISRRFLLRLAGAGVAIWPLRASNGEFWNRKAPPEWTSEEIDRLITKSPWAKTVKAQYAAGGYPGESTGGGYPGGGYPGGTGRSGGGYPGGGYPGGTGRSGGGIGIPGIGGINIPGLGGRNRGNGTSTSPYEGVVRWESARPVLEAMKAPLPEAFDGHYVISVSGIPLLGGRMVGEEDDERTERRKEQDEMDVLKGMSSLQVKGRELVQAGVAARQVAAGSSFLFGFSRELLPLAAHDGEILFRTQLGNLIVKATFQPKEMLYRGVLAV